MRYFLLILLLIIAPICFADNGSTAGNGIQSTTSSTTPNTPSDDPSSDQTGSSILPLSGDNIPVLTGNNIPTYANKGTTPLLTIPLQDQSLSFLGELFGQVGNILVGPNNAVLKVALKYFNNAALILGGIIILYSVVVSTLNTAHEGEMLGKKWNSVWIPIRSGLGFGLLLPTTSGYAVIQVIIMWVIVQGVGAADYIWSNTLSLFNPTSLSITMDNPPYSSASNMFVSQVCQSTVAGALQSKPQTTVSGNIIQYGVASIADIPDICGDATAKNRTQIPYLTQLSNSLQENATTPYMNYYQNAQPNLTYAQSVQVQRGIQNSTIQYTDDMKAAYGANPWAYSTTSYGQLYKQWDSLTPQQQKQYSKQYGLAWQAIKKGYNNQAAVSSQLKNVKTEASSYGWIYAGTYFMTLAQVSSRGAEGFSPDPNFTTSYPDKTALQNILGQNADLVGNQIWIAEDITTEANFATANSNPTGSGLNLYVEPLPKDLDHHLYKILTPLWDLISATLGYLTKNILNVYLVKYFTTATATSLANPVVSLAAWGHNVLSLIDTTFITFIKVTMAVAIAGFTFSAVNPFGYALATTLAVLVPFLFMIFAGAWLAGSMFAFYIPLVPYMLFTFGGIAWLIAVIEAMVAGPLLALGILHPEGRHDVFGHSGAGLMILASIFLRPSLMIIGFWAASILIYIAVSLVNGGFFAAAQATGGTMSIWAALSFMIMYVFLILIALNRSFSLIYVIPDKVMRWIGFQGESSGAEQDLQSIKGGYQQQGVQKMEQAGKKAMDGTTQTADAYKSAQSQEKDGADQQKGKQYTGSKPGG